MADEQNNKPEIDEERLRSTQLQETVIKQCWSTWTFIEAKKREEWQKALEGRSMYAAANPYYYQSLQNHLRSDPDSWASKGTESFVREVVSELDKKGVTFDAVAEKHIIDFLVDREVPKSAAENFVVSFVRELDPNSVPRSSIEAYVREEAEKKYNANAVEKGAILASTLSSGTFLSSILTSVVGAASGNTSDNYKSEQAQKAFQEVKAAEEQNVNIPKWMLTNIGFNRFADASSQQMESAFKWAQANAKVYETAITQAVQNGERTINIGKVPVSPEDAVKGEVKSVSSGSSAQTKDSYPMVISVYDATIRYKQYIAFENALVTEQNKRRSAEMLTASVADITDDQERQKMLGQITDFKEKTGLTLQVKDGHPYYPGFINLSGSQIESLPDNLEVGMFLDASKSSLKELPSGLKVNDNLYLAGSAITVLPANLVVEGDLDLKDTKIAEIPETIKVKGDIIMPDGTKISATQEQRTQDGYVDIAQFASMSAQSAPSPSQSSTTSEQDPNKGKEDSTKQDAQYSGWDQLGDALGLSGMGDTMSNAGLTIANLPNLLLGMFNGKSSFGMNAGTLLPLAAILFGSTVKSPLLKWPLIALGVSSLFNKAGQETLSKYRGEATQQEQSQLPSQFRQYADETLNPRITHPFINDNNQLIMNIDRIPRVINVSPSLIDAYKAGALPINTLANHVLDRVDQMQQIAVEAQQTASQRYEQAQERDQGRGIR